MSKMNYWVAPGVKREPVDVINKVFRLVSCEANVDEDLLRNSRRAYNAYLSNAKHICMYIMWRKLRMNYNQIARLWEMDHKSVRYGIQKIAGWDEEGMKPDIKKTITKIVSQL